MSDRHQPREEFVDRLEAVLRREVHRRNQTPATIHWVRQSRLTFAAGLAGLVLVSMIAGGAVVAAAYQAQTSEIRTLLTNNYERRLDLARHRVTAAADALRQIEQRVAIGIADPFEAREARAKVTEAEAQARSMELQLQEVRLAGREPLNEVTAPLVEGRDFVSERWQAEMAVPLAALDLEASRLQATERRVAVGVANPSDVAAVKGRIVELEISIDTFRRKLAVRQAFVKGQAEAAIAELQMLEATADLQRQLLLRQLDDAGRSLQRMQALFDRGLVNPVTIAEQELKLKEIEAQLAKAELDLQLIRKQLTDRRRK
jgi:hypothetical protein